MRRDRSEDAAAARARWLAELSDALMQAQALAWQLGQATDNSVESMAIYGRIESLRGEVRALQLRPGEGAPENGPEWRASPWCPPPAKDDDHTP